MQFRVFYIKGCVSYWSRQDKMTEETHVNVTQEEDYLYWCFIQKANFEYLLFVKGYNISAFLLHYILAAFYYYPFITCALMLALCVAVPYLFCKFMWRFIINRMKSWIVQLIRQQLALNEQQAATPSRPATGSRRGARAQ